MRHKASKLVFTLVLIGSNALGQTTAADGFWLVGATWGGASPGYTNLTDIIIDHDVEVEDMESLNFSTGNNNQGGTLTVNNTLIVHASLLFSASENAAEVNVASGATLIIFGTLDMGKNNAGINVAAGGVLVVTGNVEDNGGGGNSIDAVGDVYVGGSSGDVSVTGGAVKPIEDLSDDGFTDVENFVDDVEAGGVDFPLPVELIHFSSEKSKENILLNWATATETNNDHFIIERSEDGEYFYEVAKVSGNGNTNEVIEYSFEDKLVIEPVEYYRLKQVDYNGDYEYFSAIRVETNVTIQDTKFMIYPNLVKNHQFNIKSNTPFELKEITVYSLNGGSVISLLDSSNKQNHVSYQVNTSGLEKGIYFLNVTTTSGKSQSSRLIIK